MLTKLGSRGYAVKESIIRYEKNGFDPDSDPEADPEMKP